MCAAEPASDASAPGGAKGESAVVVEHLTKRFGARVAFDDVSFEVGYGEVFGFLGPNGAGKTTTVRTLGTLLTPIAHPVIVSAIFAGTHVLVQLLFTPLLAGWGIWVGIAVSARSADVRVAQQLSWLGSAPLLAILALMSLNVITVSAGLAVGLAAVLLAIDLLAWRAVAAMFDRERLITGTRT